ncbi:MAG: hypothetical protein GY846_22575 [Deltaproteobacteria bacterium]|nr:hypothetical protein [Deltaproteobacteria bacterium]
MSVLVLCGANDLRTRLIGTLEPGGDEIEFCDSVTQLITRFHRIQAAPAVLILVIDRPDTLEALICVRDLFDGIPAIVVLTGKDPQMLRRVHTLGPRYISYDDGDLADVAAVFANLTDR